MKKKSSTKSDAEKPASMLKKSLVAPVMIAFEMIRQMKFVMLYAKELPCQKRSRRRYLNLPIAKSANELA